jgi:hypothetical protein
MAKTKYKIMIGDDAKMAPGNDIVQSPIVPNGKNVRLREFGGCTPAIGDGIDGFIGLQWGSSGSWESIAIGCHEFQRELKRDFLGDGTKRFRIVRMNESAVNRYIVAWLDAILL